MGTKQIIDALKTLGDDYPWYKSKDPPEIYIISARGLYQGFSRLVYPIEGPFVISKRDFKGLSRDRTNYEPKDRQWGQDEEEVVEMFDAGCKPNVEYYRWSEDMREDEEYHEWNDIFDIFTDMMLQYGEPISWDNMSDEYLLEWYQVLEYAKQGYTSMDEAREK